MLFIHVFFQILLFLVSCTIVFSLFHFLVTGNTPSVSTPDWVIGKMAENREIKDGDIFYDLGCGTGRLIFNLSEVFTGTNFIGIENSLPQYLFARVRSFFLKRRNVSIKFENFLKTDLSDADHIYVWIYLRDIKLLKEKFEKELKSGCYIYSLDFPMPDVPVYKTIELKKTSKFGHTLFIYRY